MDYRRNYRRTICTLTMITMVGFMAGPIASAQQQTPQQQTQEQAPDIDVSDEEVEAAALAYVRVEEITARYRAEFGQTQDPQEAAQIQQELRSETDAAIEEEGLDPERYDKIIQAARADEELRNDLLTRITELQAEDESGD